jgi:hypothetical protein
MHMKNFSFALHTVAVSVIAAFAVACSSDEAVTEKQPGVKETVTLTAFQPGDEAATRMGFDKQGDAYWHAADKIGVWSSTDNAFSPLSLSKGAGEATATFTGETTDPKGQYAVYPYNENHKLSGSSLTYYLPDSYTYTSVDQTFFPEDNNGSSFCAPMYGQVSDNNTVSFKHLGGVLCIKIDKMPAETGTVKVTEATNKLCGEFSATLTETDPEIKTAAASGENFAVTFTYSGATKDAVGVFYLPVATGTYNLTIAVSGGNQTSTVKATAIEMTRAELKVVKVTTNYSDYSKDSDGNVIIDGHKFIDLGLPSGTLWAETNVGATSATDYGDFFQWGDTDVKTTVDCFTYNNKYYKSKNYTKYNSTDGLTELESSDDAAYVVWGSFCHMPTFNQMQELVNKCPNTNWGTQSSVYGRTLTGTNGKTIFLPAAGYRSGYVTSKQGTLGYYWTSSLNASTSTRLYAYDLYVRDTSWGQGNGNRDYGYAVRPVAEP